MARELSLDRLSTVKLGRLLSDSDDVCREGEVSPDYAGWSFPPSYNVHFFRRTHSVDEYVVVAARIRARRTSGSRIPPTHVDCVEMRPHCRTGSSPF